MANTEWWQRGLIDGIPPVLQPVAHILLQVRESVGELVVNLSEPEWNARPSHVASVAFHVRHITGVIDRLFTYARGEALSAEQFGAEVVVRPEQLRQDPQLRSSPASIAPSENE